MKFTELILNQQVSVRVKAEEKCPPATSDIKLNIKNRQKAIDDAGYGPLNPSEKNDAFWNKKTERWDVTVAEAKKQLCGNCAVFIKTPRMLNCIEAGLGNEEGNSAWEAIKAGDLGYCEAFDFKCASARTCDAWVGGGPVLEEKALGRSIGRAISNNAKPNVGKNPKDGDGDGFIFDFTTGLDNVPFKPLRPFDGSGRNRNRVNIDLSQFDLATGKRKPTPKKPDAEEKPKFDLKPPPKNSNTKENIFDETSTEDIFKEINQKITWLKKMRGVVFGDSPPPPNRRQRSGQTEEAWRDSLKREYRDDRARFEELKDALKRRGYDDVEEARLEYNRSKRASKSLQDPEGGLSAAGREFYNRTEGSNLKPGVKGRADTPEKMRRKGSFLTRFFTNPSGPMKDEKGEPTRLALSAVAWGEPVPQNAEDAKELAAKGRRMLERYKNSKDKN